MLCASKLCTAVWSFSCLCQCLNSHLLYIVIYDDQDAAVSTKRAAAEEKSAPDEKRGRIGTRLTVLVHDKYNCAWMNYYQTLRQDATLTLLDELGIPTDVVDGMRSSELQKKDELCDISGIRESPRRPYSGQVYPQIFLLQNQERSITISVDMIGCMTLTGNNWRHYAIFR